MEFVGGTGDAAARRWGEDVRTRTEHERMHALGDLLRALEGAGTTGLEVAPGWWFTTPQTVAAWRALVATLGAVADLTTRVEVYADSAPDRATVAVDVVLRDTDPGVECRCFVGIGAAPRERA